MINMGGLMILKKIGLLVLLISASFLSTSFAGRGLVNNLAKEGGITHEEVSAEQLHHKEANIHERLLRVNTKDYGTYDPAPTFVKPPFKLIPN